MTTIDPLSFNPAVRIGEDGVESHPFHKGDTVRIGNGNVVWTVDIVGPDVVCLYRKRDTLHTDYRTFEGAHIARLFHIDPPERSQADIVTDLTLALARLEDEQNYTVDYRRQLQNEVDQLNRRLESARADLDAVALDAERGARRIRATRAALEDATRRYREQQ